MKTIFTILTAKVLRRLTVLGAILGLAASTATAATSFIEGISGFEPIDSQVDSEGYTYLVGKTYGTGVIKKYDPSGGLVYSRILTNSSGSIVPTCFFLSSKDTLFITTVNSVMEYNRDGGMIKGPFQDTTTVFRGVTYARDPDSMTETGSVYICGVRGDQAVLFRLNDALTAKSGEISFNSGITLFPWLSLSFGASTANSVVTDEAGNVYIGGFLSYLFLGTNNVYVFNPQGFQFNAAKGFTIQHYTGIEGLGTMGNKIRAGQYSSISYDTVLNNPNLSSQTGIRAMGEIFLSDSGEYTFYSTTDDGSGLWIDGQELIYDNTDHSKLEVSGAAKLRSGLHAIEYQAYNNGGPGSYELKYAYAGSTNKNFVKAVRNTGNHGYVFKFDRALNTLMNTYLQTGRAGVGGDYFKLVYSKGWVYGAGRWAGSAENGGVIRDDAEGYDLEIVKLDTNLRIKGRATAKGANNQTGFSLSPTEDGEVYFTGNFGPGSVDLVGPQDRATTDLAADGRFATISASKENRFVAKLNGAMNYEWVRYPVKTPPTFSAGSRDATVCWNPVIEKCFWSGAFAAGTLTLGEPDSLVDVLGVGSMGYLAVLDPDGKFTERVNLTVVSQYGQSGSQVMPYGGPKDIPVTRALIKDAYIAASVPKYIYRDIRNRELPNPSQNTIEQQAETRFACTGYSMDNGTITGEKESYTFRLSQDSLIEFRWATEYALTVRSDLSGTTGGSGGLSSDAAGSPNPMVKKHWVLKDEIVAPQIDGVVLDQSLNNNNGLVRYIVTGYNASGPPNTFTALGSTNVTYFAFPSIENRQQVPQFAMRAPATITYKWKKQIGVQMITTGPESYSFPLVNVLWNPPSALVPQQNGLGSGTFWYDEHTRLQALTLEKQDTKQVKGWFAGDGIVFGMTGSTNDLTTRLVTNGVTYVGKTVLDLLNPVKAIWDYGDRIFNQTNFIGNPVRLDATTIDDPAILAKMRITEPPVTEEVIVNSGPPGSTALQMVSWDEGGQKLFPMRPGEVLIPWKTTDANPKSRVLVRVFIKYPPTPHYNHIADTPAVNLDPDPNDAVTFKEIKYTEPGAVVDNNQGFTCTNAGMTVLLFNEKITGRGTTIITYRVRVVRTTLWNQSLGPNTAAVIGDKITSAYDTAKLDTGYLFFPMARYNIWVHDREKVSGPIIPVNLEYETDIDYKTVVVWYEKRDSILWPYKPVRYMPQWPTSTNGLGRIVIASRFGNECVAPDGKDQIVTPAKLVGTNLIRAETTFNPSRFLQAQIYNQPDTAKAGYNPNEEHALMSPSLRSAAVSPRPMAAYALRDNDLNVTNRDASYTSDPYVLVQFYDTLDKEFKMRVYKVVREDANTSLGPLSYSYKFTQEMKAGEPVIPFYPLVNVIGASPCPGTYGREGAPSVQRTFWKDHKGTGWAVSGNGFFFMYFYYPMLTEFWWPEEDGLMTGDCVAWLSRTPRDTNEFFSINYTRNDQVPQAQQVKYTTVWPDNLPILKVGETLTFAGGENRADYPTTQVLNDQGEVVLAETPGLPGAVAWACGEVVFDTLNPLLNEDTLFHKYSVRIFQALEERSVKLAFEDLPVTLSPASGRSRVKGGNYVFNELPASLQKRIYFDPIRGKLCMKGYLNDKDNTDTTLTASPGAVYVLEPNVMTTPERDAMKGLVPDNTEWTDAVDALYKLTRNPGLLDEDGDGGSDDYYYPGLGKADDDYRVGIEQMIIRDVNGIPFSDIDEYGRTIVARNDTKAAPLKALGPGLAVMANPEFMNPLSNTPDVAYVTLAENNDESLGGSPVVLHIIKVDKRQRYRGAIKTIYSDNVFDENIQLRHTGDFAGNAEALVFEWWYRPEDGIEARTPDRATPPNPWKIFADPSGRRGQGYYQITLKGNPSAPEALLADTLFYTRYRHVSDTVDGVNWAIIQPNGALGVPFQWAGAGNSSPNDLDGDGYPDYKPQLAMGWIKRVLDAVNPYEARIRNFEGDAPATYSSMIRQFGQRFEGPVALNPDKNVIENMGLIELYQTVLKRGRDLSIDLSTPVATPAIANALQLAATRLLDFYTLLGNEAYSDAQNPTIAHGSAAADYGHLPPTVFAFQNAVSTLAEEELCLLRGVDDNKARPVYNRLFWNFMKGEGEAAYALNYNISDVNRDGFINEYDAMILYPQGHGDAWGHYLAAAKMQYGLLRHSYFNWVSRSEFYNLMDIVIPVDFLDERKFAQVAAAKAKAGTEILNLTYRSRYVEDPSGQWQGYTDSNRKRGWGVEEWARRTGQAAYFDWIMANALIPATHPNTNLAGIRKVDRTTVTDIAVVSANLASVQRKFDEANSGYNPLGLSGNVVSFDLNPNALMDDGQTHFDQMFDRAVVALQNAGTALENANAVDNMIRQVANSEEEFTQSVREQDLAYRNQLIEIFGTPYEGTIGSGKPYPAGYAGPDTMLYMYVEVQDVTDDSVPKPAVAYVGEVKNLIGNSTIKKIDNDFRKRFAESFSNENIDAGATSLTELSTDFTVRVAEEDVDDDTLRFVSVPVMASGYTYVAPPDWGSRKAEGELQSLINQMVQAEADLALAVDAWEGAASDNIANLKLLIAKMDKNKEVMDLQIGQATTFTALKIAEGVFKVLGSISEEAGEASKDVAEAVTDAIPDTTPTAGLAVSMGSVPTSPAEGAVAVVGQVGNAVAKVTKIAFNDFADMFAAAADISDKWFDFGIGLKEVDYETKEILAGIESGWGEEATKRLEAFKALEVLRGVSESYRSKVAEGWRVVEERTAFNKKVAALAQTHRYQDMNFRVSRNGAIEKYRSAFDLAARYTYLAAKAYDYDTNLDPNDPGSPSSVLSDIIRQRTVGAMGDNGPMIGVGGLAENLAWLKANYDVLRGQLGINNPQIETVTLSLRTEAYRSLSGPVSDTDWHAMLRTPTYYKTNLWQVPEFRRYCRPFAPQSDGVQPGLVFSFSTEVRSRRNIFGWPLGPMDNTFDPSVYATKISSLGVAFTGYPVSALSGTPRVYLVPIGADVMTIPNSQDLTVRFWQVLNQRIPVPLPALNSNLGDAAWRPLTDSLSGVLGETLRFSSFRAYGFEAEDAGDLGSVDSRLIGRSVWNTRWMLIIPGATLSADAEAGLDAFIANIKDVQLTVNTYGISGN